MVLEAGEGGITQFKHAQSALRLLPPAHGSGGLGLRLRRSCGLPVAALGGVLGDRSDREAGIAPRALGQIVSIPGHLMTRDGDVNLP